MKNLLVALFVIALFLSACAPSQAPAVSQNGFDVYAPVVTAAKAGDVAGAFMTIKNTAAQADWLVGASCDAAGMTQVHETTMDNGVMAMHEVQPIAIPAGQSVELKHGGYHIMLMSLKQDLTAGQTVTVKLKFQSGKEVDVPVTVQNP